MADRVLPSRDAVTGTEFTDLPRYLQDVLLPLAEVWRSGRLVDREAIDREAMTKLYADWHGTDWVDTEGMAATSRMVDLLLDAAIGDGDE